MTLCHLVLSMFIMDSETSPILISYTNLLSYVKASDEFSPTGKISLIKRSYNQKGEASALIMSCINPEQKSRKQPTAFNALHS